MEQLGPALERVSTHAGDEAYGLIHLVVSFAMEVLEELELTWSTPPASPPCSAHPEYQSLERAEPLMNFLSEMGEGMQLPVIQNEHVKILIGPENVADALKDTSVVVASYDIGDGMRGVIGVVGPTRMDYAKITARLSYLAEGSPGCLDRVNCPRQGRREIGDECIP